jgi:hypothetical protein
MRLARPSPGSWTSLPSIHAPDAIGTPLVVAAPTGGDVAVVWQGIAEGEPRVRVAWLAHDGAPREQVASADGLMLGAVSFEDAFVVVSAEASGTGTGYVLFHIMPWEPAINPLATVATPTGAVSPAHVMPWEPWIPPSMTATRALAAADIRVHEVEASEGKRALVTWWADAQHLRFVEVDEDGPVLPVETLEASGRARYPQSLVNEALHSVRDR